MATLVTAVIRPHSLDAVKDALKASGITGITVTEVKGFGRQGGKTEVYRGAEYTVEFLPKVKLEAIVPDADAASVVQTIASAAGTGKIGDGKVWTFPLGSLLRIRTGELGDDAI
jgi:nitrogen regulatory protein P-II 1